RSDIHRSAWAPSSRYRNRHREKVEPLRRRARGLLRLTADLDRLPPSTKSGPFGPAPIDRFVEPLLLHAICLTRGMGPARRRAVIPIGEGVRPHLPRDLVAQQIVETVTALEAQLPASLVDDIGDRFRLSRRGQRREAHLRPAVVDEHHRLRELALL